jgi:predicted helicase
MNQPQLIPDFIKKVIATHKTGSATEHSYRPALQDLFGSLEKNITVINEPKRERYGAPDFIIQRGDLIIGHVEAKDVGVGLRGMKDANKNQQERYRKALPNLIYTNCLDWDFYRNGELVATVTIGDYLMGIQPNIDQYEKLYRLLVDFLAQKPQSITSPKTLAEIMAGKAVLVKDVLYKALQVGEQEEESELYGQYLAFKDQLIHDVKLEDFADIYAETIAYGMFAARLHDETLDSFSRQEALTLLPKSNPFLRGLFKFIADDTLDDGIVWIIDDLAAVFQAADVKKILQGFGKLTGRNDPFLHFYETFLAAYNPAKRKARGVWYTPEAVVNFIVRAVDEVLVNEFDLSDGLADHSKITIDWDVGQKDKKGKALTTQKEVHRVQILDPATGTGTFLAEVIKQIAPKIKDVGEGFWSPYIEQNLIPRLHGFELLMASYAMCHLKLDMMLTALGYKPTGAPPRLSVYLTNSLEEGESANQSLPFAQWLSSEVKAANSIKRDMPIMCVLGNPPYLGEGGKSEGWLGELMDDYKKEPAGKEKLKERNPKWLNDLYVKFIRLSSHYIEKNGEGVLGFITNHGYLDNPTFRGMRWHLLHTFDKIYILDLHGNAKKKEVCPDGSPDKNIFDIQQGVAIMIAVKHSRESKDKTAKSLAQVFHADLWGDRATKYDALNNLTLSDDIWKVIQPPAPQYAFVQRDYRLQASYQKGFGIQELMSVNNVGIVTSRDSLVIDTDKQALINRIKRFFDLSSEQVKQQLGVKENSSWKIATVQKATSFDEKHICAVNYRPFDTRWLYYDDKMIERSRDSVMKHFILGDNIGIATARSNKNPTCDHFFLNKNITEAKFSESSTQSSTFPLYLYPDESDLIQERKVNFDDKLFKTIKKLAKDTEHGEPNEIQVFDYIYGVLHNPDYRQKYAEFLKIDFPRIPFPKTPAEFWHIASKGSRLRQLHLMDSKTIGATPFSIKGEGDFSVDKPDYRDGKIYINTTQYFDNAPEVAWKFYIGGYQPAQKWLKDRKGRTLTLDDVKHYQKILKVLTETDRVMGEIAT